MKIVEYKEGVFIPNLGIAASSFAAFLTILNLSERSQVLVNATEHFSIGIPLIVACLFLIPFDKRFPIFHLAIIWANSFFLLIGHVLCLIGLYHCFMDISPKAATNFKSIAIFIFVMTMILSILHLIGEMTKKKNQKEASSEQST